MRLFFFVLLLMFCAPLHAAEFGGHFELDLESEHNFDLDHDESDTLTLLAPELQLELSLNPLEDVNVYLQTELKRKFELKEEGKDKDRDWSLELEEVWVEFPVLDSGVILRLGRQDFEDDREWLYDQELDGLRLFYMTDKLAVELAAVRHLAFRMEFLDERGESELDLYEAIVSHSPFIGLELSAYAIKQNGRNDNLANPWWVGLRSRGKVEKYLQHWGELAFVRGDDDGDSLNGYAFDVGFTLIGEGDYQPNATFALARGNEGYRQTGYQDNDDRFAGVTSFRYYGEVLDPELSNLQIVTLGAGFRPSRKSSIDLVWHYYTQAERSDEMRDIALPDPDGSSRQLGQEIDLIIGYREIKGLKLELIMGWYLPGNAYSENDDTAFFLGSEARFTF